MPITAGHCRPTLLIVDCELPGNMSGPRLAATLRDLHKVPAILYSDRSDERAQLEVRRHGFEGIVAKSTHLDEFVGLVRHACAPQLLDPATACASKYS
jgi:DNA-binding NarL/FixJ family response regulator